MGKEWGLVWGEPILCPNHPTEVNLSEIIRNMDKALYAPEFFVIASVLLISLFPPFSSHTEILVVPLNMLHPLSFP